jgi:hypothetical protein
MFDLGGWHIGVYLMIAIDVAAVIILWVALAYGSRIGREAARDFATARNSDRATRRLYRPQTGRTHLR